MKLEMYSVFDAAVGAYNRPLFMRSRGEALRSFADAVAKEENGFLAHAEHYSFWLVGEFDDSTGVVLSVEPVRVCSAVDFVPARKS